MMKLRDLGKRSGLKVNPVSMGAMRFPKEVDDAVRVIRHGIDSGMVYIDTCRRYGDSELKLREALRDGYREKVILSTKWAPWNETETELNDSTADCLRKRLEQSLERLGVEYLDFYQAWDIKNRDCFERFIAPGGMLEAVLQAKEEGLVRHIGMTTHDTVENALDYLDRADWCESILVSYNLLNTTYAPVLDAAARKGIGTQIMNPMGGGVFSEESEVVAPIAREAGCVSVADLAVRFLFSNPNIDTILCGVSRMSDVDDTIASAGRSTLDENTLTRIDQLAARMEKIRKDFCTRCGYCMPCPEGINIPLVMNAVFHHRDLGATQRAARIYAGAGEKKAESCVKCGKCEDKCTQGLSIMECMDYCLENL